MPIGLMLAIFTTICILLIFLFNTKTKRFFSSYWFYSITSIVFIIYFIAFRWIRDIQDWITNNDNNYLGGMDVVKSKVLLLDMCPFGAVILSVFLIIDRKRFFASAISYFGIIGGAITIYGQIMFEGVGKTNFSWINIVPNTTWWEYIFFHQIYFLMHFFLLIMSIIVLMNTKGYNWKKIITSHSYAIFFYSYISIIVFTLDIKWNATGIVENDWSSLGEYATIGAMLNLPWPWSPIIVFLFVWILILFLMFIRNLMVLDSRFNTRDLVISWKLKHKYIDLLSNKFNLSL